MADAISEAIEEVVESAVKEEVEEAAEEVEEAAEHVEEAAEEVEEQSKEEPAPSTVDSLNAALELDERIRSIAREEASEAVAFHAVSMPHGETVIIEAPEPPPPPIEETSEEDEEPRVDHPWFRNRGGTKE
jgi:hypothetical protein